MQDRKGNTLAVGDRVYVLPHTQTRTGGSGWLRAISIEGDKARVDDGGKEERGGDWTWSAWVKPAEVEKL